MRVLGIDPGLTRCGYAVIDGSPGRPPRAITYAVLRTPPTAELGQRLLELSDAIAVLIMTYQPEVLAVERVFSQHNVRTVMGTGQAAGVAILAAALSRSSTRISRCSIICCSPGAGGQTGRT